MFSPVSRAELVSVRNWDRLRYGTRQLFVKYLRTFSVRVRPSELVQDAKVPFSLPAPPLTGSQIARAGLHCAICIRRCPSTSDPPAVPSAAACLALCYAGLAGTHGFVHAMPTLCQLLCPQLSHCSCLQRAIFSHLCFACEQCLRYPETKPEEV